MSESGHGHGHSHHGHSWHQPQEGRGPGMIIALAVITGAIVVQGWDGGALVTASIT